MSRCPTTVCLTVEAVTYKNRSSMYLEFINLIILNTQETDLKVKNEEQKPSFKLLLKQISF